MVSVQSDSVTVELAAPPERADSRIPVELLDNNWHTLEFLFQLGNLYLNIDGQSTIIANATYNTLFLTDEKIKDEAAILILGTAFTGCLQHGPGLLFDTSSMIGTSVEFGPCILAPGPCTDHDVLIRNQVNHCINDPCMQHGTCYSRADGYECHCTTRFMGKNCEIDKGSQCDSQPCQNGGTCNEDNVKDYNCFCVNGFSGRHCETEIKIHPLCEKNPCQNNGTCKVPESSPQLIPPQNAQQIPNIDYECDCMPGFSGQNCEKDLNDCESAPCLNNGTCIDKIDSFQCNCNSTGYTGYLCQTNIDECSALAPCLNGGVCYDTYGSYICECSTGYGGKNCDSLISECQSQPCQQGGTCKISKNGGVECLCPVGFSGNFCEIYPPCAQCPSDSECVGGSCVCKAGMTGELFFLDNFL